MLVVDISEKESYEDFHKLLDIALRGGGIASYPLVKKIESMIKTVNLEDEK